MAGTAERDRRASVLSRWFTRAVPALVRAASLVVVIAASVVVLSILAIPWYRHVAYADALTAWTWVPESGLDLGLAGFAAATGLAGFVAGMRLPRPLAALGALASIALAGLIVFRLVQYPDIGVDVRVDGKPKVQPGLLVALVAAAVLVAASLTATWAIARKTKTCPDCAEQIRANVEDCPHCRHHFPLADGWKRCPQCAGKIKAEALVCKHCNARLADGRVSEPAGPMSGPT